MSRPVVDSVYLEKVINRANVKSKEIFARRTYSYSQKERVGIFINEIKECLYYDNWGPTSTDMTYDPDQRLINHICNKQNWYDCGELNMICSHPERVMSVNITPHTEDMDDLDLISLELKTLKNEIELAGSITKNMESINQKATNLVANFLKEKENE